ncbi:hypothetical protein [Myxococcus virescens]|uniref:Predicted phosphohydrolase, Cof family, HAD superfamily n=1 Tax=Myxococcus virescens TaxID=83456 RepID=A0A511HNM5_9BACT|nr:hypothetical protein [Myxococcus virescens]GEL75190.1 hypothetical protein MVI01_69740 [Myxococcus virescens]SDD64842.1 Predicted phosphohydrolase, Cof family, HAD superfamily [Myxococcus virescens]
MSCDPYQDKVRQFHEATGQPAPDAPTMPDAATRVLRVRLMVEEVLEYAKASGVRVIATANVLESGRDVRVSQHPRQEPDLVAMAHENTDVLYVALGNAVAMGVPAQACFDEVAGANLRKAPGGKVTRREDGKVVKPEGWVPADVGAVLARRKG